MKRVIIAILLFSLAITAQTELSGASSSKDVLSSHEKKSHSKKQGPTGPQGPKGEKGGPGQTGPVVPDVTEYMNLANIPSKEGLEYDLKPFCFEFSNHSPNTKCIEYGSDDQGTYILLRSGKYLVSYELQGLLCLTGSVIFPACQCYDSGTGWVVELIATIPETTEKVFSHKKCASPVNCLGFSDNIDEAMGEDALKQVRHEVAAVTLSHSQIIEIPQSTKWCMRLRSISYPFWRGKPRTHALSNIGAEDIPYKLCFLGHCGVSPINLSIMRFG